MEKQRKDLLAIYKAAIGAVAGDQVVEQHLGAKANRYNRACHVIAIGKVADAMMQGALKVLQQKLLSGLVISKTDTFSKKLKHHSRIRCIAGDHPIPAKKSLQAGQELLHYIQQLPSNAECLLLISGGTSSLVEVLADDLSLEDLQAFNHYLLASGQDIHHINAVRKRLSAIKNGGLWQFLAPRKVRCLMISDVRGDDPSIIGSGLLFNTPQTHSLSTLLPSSLYNKLPPLKSSPSIPKHFDWHIIACLDDAKLAAQAEADRLGYSTHIVKEFMQGSAEAMGQHAVAVLQDSEYALLIWGGETTVELPKNTPKGGRNQQVALSAAVALQGKQNQYVLAIASDGVDGTSLEAGALVDGLSMQRGELFGLSAIEALKQTNATLFLEESGDLIYTGASQTNVMDLLIALKIET